MLEARLVAKDHYKSEDEIRLTFELENKGQEDVKVLKWFTPLEGLWSDCLTVSRGGKKLPYDGRLAKRSTPTAEDYTLIKAGATVSAEVRVHEGYKVSREGAYQIEPDPNTFDWFPVLDNLVSPASRLAKRTIHAPLALEKRATRFTVVGRAEQLTLGEQAREVEQKRATVSLMAKTMAKATGPLEPQFNGGDAQKQTSARQAHFDGYALCQSVLKKLAKDSHYKDWFGTPTTARFQAVKKSYQNIAKDIESKTFTYDLTFKGCKNGVFAYTYKKTTTIWLCDAFWAAPATGTDSKAGTIVHEHGHTSADLDDIIYGQGNCRQLAISSPAKAIKNADSHEYFAGG